MVLTIVLLVAGFVLDLMTIESLIVAIVFNIPIALSGLALSRKLTFATVAVAFMLNALAGFFNLRLQGFDTIVVLNRVFAGFSYLFVGYLSVSLRNASSRATALELENTRAEREHNLREATSQLSEPLYPQELLERSATVLRSLLQAENVAIVGVSQGRFTLPHVSDPPVPGWLEGDTVTWAIAALPQHGASSISVRLYDGLLTVGRWRRREEDDLIILVRHPKASNAALLLSEMLRSLEPLLERAKLITNVEVQRQSLEHRNEVIRDLIYAFSHDLRTPLIANAVTMRHAVEGAYGELRGDFKATLLNGIRANEELLELAESLLLIARLESGELPSNPAPVDLIRLVKDIVERSAPAHEGRHITVRVNAPDKLVVLGHAGELGRVIQNLLDNAMSFSPQGGTITVNLSRADEGSSAQGMRLEVLDEGPGVSERQQKRLFKRFSSGRAGGGKGLGLYLARQIVEMHGGYIGYRAGEVSGSCFSVWLPIAREVVTA